jgi:hypothetical protein
VPSGFRACCAECAGHVNTCDLDIRYEWWPRSAEWVISIAESAGGGGICHPLLPPLRGATAHKTGWGRGRTRQGSLVAVCSATPSCGEGSRSNSRPSNKEMKLTSVEHIERSQLISGVRRTLVGDRRLD